MFECFWCEEQYDGARYRWRCPSCGFKETCCEGEPQKKEKADG